ncbi:MAG TPA: DUF4389 domain-containing protein [Sulfurovum sp.]|jgi:hypothetical protein|nr:MAG: hypothetical protein B7Y63_00970 [Sulfurovum sp. 35-42-20]OYY54691.1 MAG: hypothetical protein B7Y52_06945 [Sulfurovum sp. 28-43-6]OYZ26483.1 MAG: hypothetical protein B7Y23_02045 [Sulfurovum sp. 16-42-52]OYZ50077.1 MAG: hypothetical protein B7Y13_02210 [Sulfurovum sp. 24-42-9]OZA46315.1 MAG: hypothetical protein B7X80_02510 [Sulfurovum sp. 17-42-90]OZA60408.1 MAG: hypothetical protein B7X69_03770 [Sulfurovum sp. 39-42-12]HQR73257.1 DUF4389 domain-containing protein [Sulfurovum sp.]
MEEFEMIEREKGISRVLFTLLYLIIGRVIAMVIFVIAITQFIYLWVSGEPNDKILEFSGRLSEYSKQIVAYVSFNTDEKPWPVGDWPTV